MTQNNLLSGIALHLYTTEKEIYNAKKGITTIVGYLKEFKPVDALYHISVPANVCDIVDEEVRINLNKIQSDKEKEFIKAGNMIGKAMSDAMGKEMQRLMNNM